MIFRILGASLLALGLGFVVEATHAGDTRLCSDGRIVQVVAGVADPCIATTPSLTQRAPAATGTVPLPVKRPARGPRIGLKGPTEAERAPAEIGAVAAVAGDYRRVPIINAQPGAARWYDHTR